MKSENLNFLEPSGLLQACNPLGYSRPVTGLLYLLLDLYVMFGQIIST